MSTRDRGRARSGSPGRRSNSPHKKRSKSPKKGKKGGGSGAVSKTPEEWTKADIMDKVALFGVLELDKTSGSGRLEVFNKRLLDEEITVIMEILRRYTEVQHVTLRKCYLTDETLEKLMPLLVDLRHLRTLCLSQNALTSATAMAVHHNFSHKKRRILNLDMRENVLNEHDGQMIYHSFHAGIEELHGISIKQLKKSYHETISEKRTKEAKLYDPPSIHARLNLPSAGLKICEMAIVGNVIREQIHIQWLDLSKNHIDALGLKVLIGHLAFAPYVRYIDLSNNPLTNNGKDMSGMEELVLFSRTHTSLCQVMLDKLYPDTPDLRNLIKKLERSCSVNRTVRLSSDVTKERQRGPHEEDQTPIYEEFFESFMIHKFFRNQPPLPVDPLKNWNPKDEIDKDFCINNKLDTMTVEPTVHKIYGERDKEFCLFNAIFHKDSDILTVVDINNLGDESEDEEDYYYEEEAEEDEQGGEEEDEEDEYGNTVVKQKSPRPQLQRQQQASIEKKEKKVRPHIVIGAPIEGRGIKSKAESDERKEALKKKKKSALNSISQGLSRITSGGGGKAKTMNIDDGLDWEDTIVLEYLEGPMIGGPGKYRISQTPYQNSGLTHDELNEKKKTEEMQLLKEKQQAELLGPAGRKEFERRKREESERLQQIRYDIDTVTELKCAGEPPLLDSYPGIKLKRVGDGPYSRNRKF